MTSKSFLTFKKKDIDTSILLKDINIETLDKEYNIQENIPIKNISFINKKTKSKKNDDTLNINLQLENSGLVKEQKKFEPTISKINDSTVKNGPKVSISFNKNTISSDQCINLNCWWCRHPIPQDIQVLGCPLHFVNNIFQCEGAFCSFNCIKSYIEDKHHYNMKYRESISLTLLYYSKVFNKDIIYSTLFNAPHWTLLSIYGGNLSIEEFRNEFQKIEYYGPVGCLVRDITKSLKTAFTFIERQN